ncbi:MAG: hypothetical protein LCH69_10015 [Proteobacteria bacterium]|nr:hypothetical protein [Pseudomonadota bacterium]
MPETRIQDAMSVCVTKDLESEADVVSAIEAINAAFPAPIVALSEIRQKLAAVMMKAGFPPPDSLVFHKGRYWCAYTEGDRPRGKALSPGWSFTTKKAEPLSQEHEAAIIYRKTVEVEGALTTANVEALYHHAFSLGVAVDTFNKRRLHLRKVAIGMKQLDAGKSGGAQRTAESFKSIHGAEAQLIAVQISRKSPNLSWAAIRKVIAAKYQVSDKTVKDALRNPKKQG